MRWRRSQYLNAPAPIVSSRSDNSTSSSFVQPSNAHASMVMMEGNQDSGIQKYQIKLLLQFCLHWCQGLIYGEVSPFCFLIFSWDIFCWINQQFTSILWLCWWNFMSFEPYWHLQVTLRTLIHLVHFSQIEQSEKTFRHHFMLGCYPFPFISSSHFQAN